MLDLSKDNERLSTWADLSTAQLAVWSVGAPPHCPETESTHRVHQQLVPVRLSWRVRQVKDLSDKVWDVSGAVALQGAERMRQHLFVVWSVCEVFL